MHLRHNSIKNNNFFIKATVLLFSAIFYVGLFPLVAQTVLQKIYVDFGPNDVTNGNITTGPDANSNYWNNASNPASNASTTLVNAANTATGFNLVVTAPLLSNGIQNGGLLSPNLSLLAEMAIATATQDYFFTTTSGSLKLTGLNSSKAYKFYLFGSRNNADPARITAYTLNGLTTSAGNLQSSGTNLGGAGYNGNNSSFFISDVIIPDAAGKIFISIAAFSGGFGYLNMMKVEELSQVDASSIAITGSDISALGATSQMSLQYIPANATAQPPSWSVNNTKTATISATGVLTPKKNGTVTVSASILQNTVPLTATKTIVISNQLSELYLSGTATVNGNNIATAIPMNRTPDVNGFTPGMFELYTKISSTGTLQFYTTQNSTTAAVYGAGGPGGTTQTGGPAIDPADSGYMLIRVNLFTNTYTIYPIDTLKYSQMGSSVSNGFGATNRLGYAYQYGQLQNQRFTSGQGKNWKLSNISVDGNNTFWVLGRWDNDLLNNKSRYVVYALSLSNEGIAGGGQSAFDQFKKNMLLLIAKARSVGKIPIVTNAYSNGNFGSTEYNFTKQMNLLMHEWDVASINLLGAIDDGAGRWAFGYQNDAAHPNNAGHAEMFYTMVPSLFNALSNGKPQPVKINGTYLSMGKSVTSNQLSFIPENIVHSFTTSFNIRTTQPGTIASFTQGSGKGKLSITASTGYPVFNSPNGGTITGNRLVNDGQWHKITLTHFYARGETILYTDSVEAGRINEKLTASNFLLNDPNAPFAIDYQDWFFYRSGMNREEITQLSRGKMLKSSLELYAPLDGQAVLGNDTLINLAQSTNKAKTISSRQNLYIFNGNGNWSNAANWLNSNKPPPRLAAGTEVRITPMAGGQCFLDVPVYFLYDAFLYISPHAKFTVVNNISIYQNLVFLFVPGAYQNWSPATAPLINEVEGQPKKFDGFINFPGPDLAFKYTNAPDWNNTNYGNGNIHGTFSTSPAATNLFVPTAGYYYLTADINSAVNGWTATKTNWSVIGDATSAGANTDSPMNYDTASQTWQLTSKLTASGSFRFRANNQSIIALGVNTTGKLAFINNPFRGNDGTLQNITVPTDGNYTITLNLSLPGNFTYSVMRN